MEKKNKKIAFVIPSLHAGGMERVMSELANYTAQKSFIDCYLISLSSSNEFYKLDETVNYIKPNFDFNNKKRLTSTLKLLFFLRKNLKSINPNSVLSFGETYNSFVLLSALGLGLNVFVSDRSKPDKDWGFLHNKLRKILYPTAKGIVAQTIFSKNFLSKETKHKNIKVIPNPVDSSKFLSRTNQKIVLTVGRLISTKRVDILIDAFAKSQNKDWQLWIVGDGPKKAELEQKVINSGLTDKVTFFGFKKDIQELYSKTGIFAFTSYSEGFPNAILEAMASGLPVIAFDCIAGPADLIENEKTGFLIPLGNVEDFQKKLNIMMTSAELLDNFSNNTKVKVLGYDINKIGIDYLNFLLS